VPSESCFAELVRDHVLFDLLDLAHQLVAVGHDHHVLRGVGDSAAGEHAKTDRR
jgi:hypothetical protein